MVSSNVQRKRVFINAVPKAGTHLLARAVELFGYQEHFRGSLSINTVPIFLNYREATEKLQQELTDTDPQDDTDTIEVGTLASRSVSCLMLRRWIGAMAHGCYILGHIPYSRPFHHVLAELDYYHVCIIRDPRAVVASLIPFILNTGNMPKPHFLANDLRPMSPVQRVRFILEGGYAPHAGVTIRGINELYSSMLAWRQDPSCLVLRFEDLIGEQGAGTLQQQQEAMTRLAAHLNTSYDTQKRQDVYSSSSRTFRTGKIDGWKQSLDLECLQLVEDYCTPLCREAGYTEGM